MGLRLPTPNDLVRDCLRLLNLRGLYAWRNNTGAARFGRHYVKYGAGAGGPDILAVLPRHADGDEVHPPGRLLGVECKTGGGALEPAQRAWHANATSAGVVVFVVRSIDELDHSLSVLIGGPW